MPAKLRRNSSWSRKRMAAMVLSSWSGKRLSAPEAGGVLGEAVSVVLWFAAGVLW